MSRPPPNFAVFSFLIVATLASACASAAPAATPTATRPPACKVGVCIDSVFLYLDEEAENVRVEFSLVDPSGEVKVGAAPQIQRDITVGLFRPSDDTFLFAATVPQSLIICYAGNDMPWSNGQYASSCGFTLPASQFQFRPNVGDEVRLETVEFDSANSTTIQAEP